MVKKFTRKPQLSEMTLREKIGQTAVMQISLFMNKENLEEYLVENPMGNVWHNGNFNLCTANLFPVEGGVSRDSKYYRKWLLKLRDMLAVPPLVGLDPPSSGVATDLCDIASAPTVGATNSPELAEYFGRTQAKIIRSVGGNYDWAPVADIPSRFCSVATMRAMSDQLDKLVEMESAMIKGMQKTGVAATAKHFPGMDKVEYRDTHFSPVCIHSSIEEWKEEQGEAFQRIINNGVYSIMIGHMAFPAVDDRKIGNAYVPATISYNIITKLLKEEMGFDGMVITDSIDMASLAAAYPDKEEMYIELINAGNDLLLNVRDYDYIDIIEKAVKKGLISESRIDDACGRILNIKEKLGLFGEPEEIEMDDALKNEVSEMNRIISEKAITLECDIHNRLPLDADKIHKATIICSAHRDKAFEALEYMKEALEERGIEVRLQRRLKSSEEIEEIDKESDLIIYAGYIAPHAPMGAGSFYDEECETFYFAFNKGAEKSIGVSLGSPFVYYDFYMYSQIFVHIYSLSREAQRAFVKAIFGEIPFEGEMPFEKPGPRKE